MSSFERLVDLLAAQYRWGLHPLKLLAALLIPLVIVWVADRRLRALSQVRPEPGAKDPAAAGRATAVTDVR